MDIVFDVKPLSVNLPGPTVSRLENAAQQLGVSVDHLLLMSIEEKLARVDDDFRWAVEQVVSKNAEISKRLS